MRNISSFYEYIIDRTGIPLMTLYKLESLSLESNIELVLNNAKVGAEIAKEYSNLINLINIINKPNLRFHRYKGSVTDYFSDGYTNRFLVSWLFAK